MENDLAAQKKFIYMIEGFPDVNGESATIWSPELPAVSLESAQALCDKWHEQNPQIEYKPILFFKMETC